MLTPAARHLDAAALARVRSLEWHARGLVEGLLAGTHRSPQRGFAAEFAQHREYSPGDDVRRIDWKLYARSERYYLKQYEQDSDLTCWLVLDGSASMGYGSGDLSKYDLACRAAAALTYLLLRQSDAVGLILYAGSTVRLAKPSAQSGHLRDLLRVMAGGPGGGDGTGLAAALRQAAERAGGRRGLVAVFSDLFDDSGALAAGLRRLRYHGHEVAVFHTLDGAEIDFPFERSTLFRGLEGAPDVLTDPRGVRREYLAALAEFRREVRDACRAESVDLVELRTDRPLESALAGYLAARLRR